MTYIAVMMSGEVLDNRGTGYASRAAARAAAERRGTVAVETRRLGESLPHCNDAQGWDRVRLAAGIAAW
jgi:hypothetical protein